MTPFRCAPVSVDIGEIEPFVDPRDTIFSASYGAPPVPIKLYLPIDSTAEIAEIERQGKWTGRVQVVGFDASNHRLLIKSC